MNNNNTDYEIDLESTFIDSELQQFTTRCTDIYNEMIMILEQSFKPTL